MSRRRRGLHRRVLAGDTVLIPPLGDGIIHAHFFRKGDPDLGTSGLGNPSLRFQFAPRDVIFFRPDQAEYICLAPILAYQVAVVGKLRLSEWTTADGERRSRIQVVADAVQFLDPPKKTDDPDGGVAEPADKPEGRPAVGAYRRKAS